MRNTNSKGIPLSYQDKQPPQNQTQNRLHKTQIPPPRPTQNLDNTNINLPPSGKRIQSSKQLPPKYESSQKIVYNIEDNMTNSRISEAKVGLQLLKKKMSRNGMSRDKPNLSVQKKEEVSLQPNLKKHISKPESRGNQNEQYYQEQTQQRQIKKPVAKNSQKSINDDYPMKRNETKNEFSNPNEEVPITKKQDFYALLEKQMEKQSGYQKKDVRSPPIQTKKSNQIPSQYEENPELIQCSKGCGRMFNDKAIEKHQKVCQKVFLTKRKAFDSAAARQPDVQDFKKPTTESYNPPKNSGPEKKKVNGGQRDSGKQKIPKWKLQSLAFRAGLKAGKNQQLTSQEKAILQDNSGMTQCTFCGRKFNENAAKRHIPFCESKSKQLPKMNVSKKK